MKRPWFSRRWVVQGIALANEGILQCGNDTIKWKDFADAVALFVEVETATHRLSEVMKRDETYNYVPEFFGEVNALGASLLINATSNLFRKSKDGGRDSRLSLEHLVCSLSVFDANEPRDIINALLAVARDTFPQAATETQEQVLLESPAARQQLRAWGKRNTRSQTYLVNYSQPIVDVYKDSIVFSIRKGEPYRALDILCRPWAPNAGDTRQTNSRGTSRFSTSNPTPTRPEFSGGQVGYLHDKLSSWISNVEPAAFVMNDHPTIGLKMARKNADTLVGLPDGQRNYSAAGSRAYDEKTLSFKKRDSYYSIFVKGFILDKVSEVTEPARLGNIPRTWLEFGEWENTSEDPPEEFWRTLVADRGQHGRNAPTYYPRACKEAIKRTVDGDTLETGN